MKSIKAVITIGAIVLVAGTAPSNAQQVGANAGIPAYATSPGAFPAPGYSGFIDDDSESQAGNTGQVSAETGFVGFIDDGSTPQAQAVSQVPWPNRVQSTGYTKTIKSPACNACSQKSCDGACGADFEEVCYGGKSGQNGHGIYAPWVSFDYMHAWLSDRSIPALVSTSPPGSNGVIPGARAVFGNDSIGGGLLAAGRISGGAWLDCEQVVGFGAYFMMVERDSEGFVGGNSTTGTQLLARPFFNTEPPPQGNLPLVLGVNGIYNADNIIGSDATLLGDIDIKTDTNVMTAGGYLQHLLYRCGSRQVDLVVGYQFARIDDSLSINQTTFVESGLGLAGHTLQFQDLFDVKNQFHGGQLGLRGLYGKGPVKLSMLASLGIGNMNQRVSISGSSSDDDGAGGQADYSGGLLAMPTNMGTYVSDKFVIVPEAEIELTWSLSRHVDLSVGYSLIYWSDVAFAGDQIDTQAGLPIVNASQLLGGALAGSNADPSFTGIRDADLLLQGITLGLTIKR